jgi:hypothetical protein
MTAGEFLEAAAPPMPITISSRTRATTIFSTIPGLHLDELGVEFEPLGLGKPLNGRSLR